MDGVWGAEWVYLALSSRTPPPPPPSLPSPGLCMSSAPLLPLLSPGHSALLSIHNGSSVLGLLTLHSACALGSEHVRAGGTGGRGVIHGGQEHYLTKCHSAPPPPPSPTHLPSPPGTYQTHTHIHRWSAQNKCHPTKPWHSAEKQP